MWRCSLVVCVLSAACQFAKPGDVVPTDARTVDAAPTCAADTITCAADTYVECGPDGFATRTLACPLGCAPDVAKCLDIDPHNGLAVYLDMVPAPPDVVLIEPATIDPSTGLVFDGGTSVDIPSFVSSAGLRVFVVNSLRVSSGLTVEPGSLISPPIAIVSRGDIAIQGLIDLSARLDLAGPGGWPGTDLQHSQSAACIGRPVSGGPPSPGGGGGGGAEAGGTGGGVNGVAGGVPGVAQTELEQLRGGCAGGGSLSIGDLPGGGGGGGFQLASRTEIRFEGNGGLDVSGGGGIPVGLRHGGTGGGSGGTLIIEAPQVVLDGTAVVISTKGGGGGGASSASVFGGPGADGGTSSAPASGGTSPVGDRGGRGGLSGPPEPGGSATGGSDSGGGGGGAAGTIVLATSVGVVAPTNGAAIRGRRRDELLRTRHVP